MIETLFDIVAILLAIGIVAVFAPVVVPLYMKYINFLLDLTSKGERNVKGKIRRR